MILADLTHLDDAISELERGVERISKSSAILGAHDQSIDDDFDRVVLTTIELRRIRDFDKITIHVRADEALLADGLEELTELALPTLNEWCTHLDTRTLGPTENDVCDLSRALPLYGSAAIGTMRRAGAREEEAQVVVDLGDGADRRSRIVTRALLFDRDGR